VPACLAWAILVKLNTGSQPETIETVFAASSDGTKAGQGRNHLRERRLLGPDFIVRDVLLVEDETLIRMMTAQMVEELGHRVVAEAGNIKDAEPLALNAQFDPSHLGHQHRRRKHLPDCLDRGSEASHCCSPAVTDRAGCLSRFATDQCCENHF
jgi:hypothetical protein